MESFPNYLFLLIANLSQQRDKAKIIELFVDGLNSFLPGMVFSWEKEGDTENSIMVCTRKNNFGTISFTSKLENTERILPLLQNAAQMLAVILERSKQELTLEDRKLQLEELVEQRTNELKKQNKEYEALNEEYLSQNEELSKTLEQLLESEERYQTIIESANDAVFIANTQDGIIVQVNKKAEELMGMPREKIIGLHQSQIHPKENEKTVNRNFSSNAQSSKPKITETFVQHSSGKKIPVEINPAKIKLKDKREYLVGFFRDISKRKQAEETLTAVKRNIEESEERLRFLFENMIQGVVYHSSTAEITYANDAAGKILGLTIDQLKGKTSMNPRWHSIHEDGSVYPGEQHPVMVTLETGQPVLNSKMGVFNPIDNAYRWININSIPKFIDNQKKPYQVVVTFEDITEIIQTKKQLIEAIEKAEENEKQFRQLFENMEQGFALHKMIYNGKGKPIDYRFVLMNKSFEKLTGMNAADFIGRTVREVLPQIEQVWIDNYGKVAQGGEPLHFENYAQDLKKHYDVVAYSPRKNYFATVFTDITEKKEHEQELEKHRNHLEMLVKERTDELEASNEELKATNEELIDQKEALELALKKLNHAQTQLIQSEKMASLGILVAGVAHEINNPVNFINSSLSGLKNNLNFLTNYAELYSQLSEKNEAVLDEIIKREKESSLSQMLEMFKRSVEIIEVGVERTTKIVKGLKTFARADEKELARYDVHENIDNTLLILYNQYKNKIEIIKQYNKIPIIRCYPSQINQVLMNILINAIQAITDKGKITITTEQIEEDKISIQIDDTGSGIPESIIDKIFDPFFTTKEIGKGTGLGLAISYGIIDEHKGKISVKSNEGKGSSFMIILPVNKTKK